MNTRIIPNKAFSDWYDSLPDGEPSYQQTFEAGYAAALQAQPVQSPPQPVKQATTIEVSPELLGRALKAISAATFGTDTYKVSSRGDFVSKVEREIHAALKGKP